MCCVLSAKCRTHLFAIRTSSGPEMAFLYIPQILLHQGAWEMCTRVHIYTNNSSFLIKGVRNSPQVINHTRTELVKHPSSELPGGNRSLLHGILGTPVPYAACNKRMLFSLASFDLMPHTNCVVLIPSFCAAFLPPTLQQACRCRTWLSFQNSRSSSVQPH